MRLLKNLQSDRREVTLTSKNRMPNLPQLNNSVPEKLEFSDPNMKKSIRQNLVDKLKTFGVHNNATVNSDFIKQTTRDRRHKETIQVKESTMELTKEKVDDTHKTDENTNPEQSAFGTNTRESSHLENQKRVSRKNMLKKRDSRKFSKDTVVEQSRQSKASKKKLSLSESVMKRDNNASATHRTIPAKRASNVFQTQDTSEDRKESIEIRHDMNLTQPLPNAFSPEDSNPQQPSFPKKTWPMKPGYCIKTYKDELTEYEKGEILQYRKIYFVGTKAEKIKGAPWQEHNSGYDDEKGNYKVVIGDHIAYRYEVIEPLGKGSFGHVLKCWDHKNKMHVGLKIIRNEK